MPSKTSGSSKNFSCFLLPKIYQKRIMIKIIDDERKIPAGRIKTLFWLDSDLTTSPLVIECDGSKVCFPSTNQIKLQRRTDSLCLCMNTLRFSLWNFLNLVAPFTMVMVKINVFFFGEERTMIIDHKNRILKVQHSQRLISGNDDLSRSFTAQNFSLKFSTKNCRRRQNFCRFILTRVNVWKKIVRII